MGSWHHHLLREWALPQAVEMKWGDLPILGGRLAWLLPTSILLSVLRTAGIPVDQANTHLPEDHPYSRVRAGRRGLGWTIRLNLHTSVQVYAPASRTFSCEHSACSTCCRR